MREVVVLASLWIAMFVAAPAQTSASANNPVAEDVSDLSPRFGNRTDKLALLDMRGTVPAGPSTLQQADDQRPSDLLKVAQSALAAGDTALVQEALEMAQTRMLDRSVPIGQTNNPSDNQAVQQTSQALQALASRDRGTCMQLIEAAIRSAREQGL